MVHLYTRTYLQLYLILVIQYFKIYKPSQLPLEDSQQRHLKIIDVGILVAGIFVVPFFSVIDTRASKKPFAFPEIARHAHIERVPPMKPILRPQVGANSCARIQSRTDAVSEYLALHGVGLRVADVSSTCYQQDDNDKKIFHNIFVYYSVIRQSK